MRPPPEIDDLARRHRETWGLPRIPGDDEGMVCRHALVVVLRRAQRLGLPARDVRLEIDQTRAPSRRYSRHVIPEVYSGGRWWAIETWREGGRFVSGVRPYPQPGQHHERRDAGWYEHIGLGRAFSKVLADAPDETESGWVVEYMAKRMKAWQHQRNEADKRRNEREERRR